ncbi:hypothetical protein [Adhaeribacter radiodurans]|uniref:Uncharacterized protein n=1 Tax=Adhaeribacter radiodurans TaxID=2745197 RepID=A0A7L7L6Y0_9BACT|nr:hypothetical protein [Adhaeribacter radiodurans]QMU28591.1 hypothetical protein HUW48_11330 [Adhaeribacter radiodurans]
MDKGAEIERIKFQINFLRYSRGNILVLRSLIEDALELLDPLEEDLQGNSHFTTLSRIADKFLSEAAIKHEALLQDNFEYAQQQSLHDIDNLLSYLKERDLTL